MKPRLPLRLFAIAVCARRRQVICAAAAVLIAASRPLLAQQWQAVPLVTQAQRNSGNTGGEGCQVINGLTIDSTGNFLLMGTDVGGIYRSLDGGTNWSPCNVGYKPRGGNGPAIDPNNSSRCLIAGGNSSAQSWQGLYLSTNQGGSWQSVFAQSYAGQGDERDKIAYDPSSLSGGMSTVVYYSGLVGGLYKSVNGGQNWNLLSATCAGCIVKVHPTSGYVYLAGPAGFYRSTNGGSSFQRITSGLSPGGVQGLDVIATAPNNVYANQTNGVYISTDAGLNFTKRPGTGLPLTYTPGLDQLKVSPANSNYMVINIDTGNWSSQPHYYSTNGGNNWASVSFDNSRSFMPFNGRHGIFVWHPTQPQVCFGLGGDWITKSTDAGRTFRWNNQGYNGVLFAALFNFNTTNADLLLCTSQDYNSALTTNGGYTWTYLNVSGQGWGGFNYGGYAFSPTRMFAGNSGSWGGTRTLRVSINGGSTWSSLTNAGNSRDVACGDPNNPSVGFWDNWRTADAGSTWTAMTNCDGVYTYNPTGAKQLYGSYGSSVVKSTNSGASWTTETTISSGPIDDVAYDQQLDRLYIVGSGRRLYKWENSVLTEITSTLSSDNNGAKGANTVAVDPLNPGVVYVGKSADIYSTSTAVIRSTNAGTNWTILTKQTVSENLDGGREASCIRVHPVTRYAYVAGGCYGLWKIGPPSVPLHVVATAGSATLFWPTNTGAGFKLKHTTNLGAGLWSVVTNLPAISSSNFSVPLPLGLEDQFFRLGL